jgi:hypothetical protein
VSAAVGGTPAEASTRRVEHQTKWLGNGGPPLAYLYSE